MVGEHSDRSGLRHRKKPSKLSTEIAKPPPVDENGKKKSDILTGRRRPTNIVLVLLCIISTWLLCIASNCFVRWRVTALRTKYATETASQLYEFSTPTAMRHIRKIAAKPRWIRTKALAEAMKYIFEYVQSLKEQAGRNGLDLEIEFFKSGADSYPCAIGPIELYISYDAITSIIVRFSPKGHSRHVQDSLLINAHVDSAAGAPGASDNVVGVAVALDVLRSMSVTPPKVNTLRRPVVFLFNGGEEAVLPAAHSFVTQHPLAKSIIAHINTESLGSGDSYLLFRLGPKNSWLARAYARSVSVPIASVTASDIFEAKLVPAETDFQIFQEAGIPGFDFVLLDNGYIYHTMADDIDHVSELGVQHAGQTVLELAWELTGKSDAIGGQMEKVKSAQTDPSWRATVADRLWSASDALRLPLIRQNPSSMFFGVLGIFTVVYEDHFAFLLNTAALFSSLLFWLTRLRARDGPKFWRSIRMLAVVIGTELCSLASVTCAATIYSEVLNAKLPWYGSWLEANFVFLPPGLYGLYTAMFTFLPRKLYADRVQNMLLALSMYYGALLALFTGLHAMTGVVPLAYFVTLHIVATFWRKGASKSRIFVCFTILGLPAALFGAPIWKSTLNAFLPLFGRVGQTLIPNDVLAGLVVMHCALMFLLVPTLPILVQFPRSLRHLRTLTAVLVTFSCLHVFRSIPSPHVPEALRREKFSTDAPRRLIAIHFHAPQMNPSSVLATSSFDSVPVPQEPVMENFNNGKELHVIRMANTPQFGFLNGTYIEPFRAYARLVSNWHVYETPIMPMLAVPNAVVKKEFRTGSDFNLTIEISAPQSHAVTVRFPITFADGSAIRAWSFNIPLKPNDSNNTEAWIRHAGSEKWTFSVILSVAQTTKTREKLRIVASSSRFGVGPSKLLRRLTYKATDSPVLIRGTAVEYLL